MSRETKPDKVALFDEPRNVQRLLRFFFAVLAVLLLAEFWIHPHPHFAWEAMPFFHATYGFVACVAVIFTAKGLRWLLKRPETYYAPRPADAPAGPSPDGLPDHRT